MYAGSAPPTFSPLLAPPQVISDHSLPLKVFLLHYIHTTSLFPHIGPNFASKHPLQRLKSCQAHQFPPSPRLAPLPAVQSEHWEKVVVRLWRMVRATTEPSASLSSNLSLLLSRPCNTALGCYSGAEHSTLLRFGSALGCFTVYMIRSTQPVLS